MPELAPNTDDLDAAVAELRHEIRQARELGGPRESWFEASIPATEFVLAALASYRAAAASASPSGDTEQPGSLQAAVADVLDCWRNGRDLAPALSRLSVASGDTGQPNRCGEGRT